ncbi:hypothetical protein KGY73_11515 [bacterium]|nr:hypothetical protein [bacterium]
MPSLEKIVRISTKLANRNVDRFIKFLAANPNFHNFLKKKEVQELQEVDGLNRILLIPDINIGDALNFQAFIAVLKQFYPQIELSYVYKHKAFPLVKDNPHIDKNFPLFTSSGVPSSRDLNNLRSLIRNHHFELVLNLCPFISHKELKSVPSVVISPVRFIANIIQAYSSKNLNAHISYQLDRFAHDMMKFFPGNPKYSQSTDPPFPGNYLYTNHQLYQKTQHMMKDLNIDPKAKIVFFNPDTSSFYTQIPFPFQVQLLKGILSDPNVDLVLLNAGHNFRGIEKRLKDEISFPLKRKIILIPKNLPIDMFGPLIDESEIFISGDTGPLHIAAAKKVILNSEARFKNSTAVVDIFGATSPRIYGYDSFSDKYQSAPQNSPSKSFEGVPPCKNLTCTHKLSKSCTNIRCFEGLKVEEVIHYCREYLARL